MMDDIGIWFIMVLMILVILRVLVVLMSLLMEVLLWGWDEDGNSYFFINGEGLGDLLLNHLFNGVGNFYFFYLNHRVRPKIII